MAVDVRILATSSTNLERAVAERKFREDLYYRISTFTILVPPLRQRKEGIPILLQHFMHHLAKQYGIAPHTFSPAVIEACQQYSWPGNLAELEEFVKRYLVMGDPECSFPAKDTDTEDVGGGNGGSSKKDGTVADAWLADSFREPVAEPNSLKSLVQTVKLEAERNAIAAALEKTGWNRKAAAKLLKVSYRTILYKIEQYHMRSPETHASPLLGNGLKNKRNGVEDNEKLAVPEWERARVSNSES